MGGEVNTLSKKVDALSQDLVREVSALNNKEDNLQGEKENAEKVIRSFYRILLFLLNDLKDFVYVTRVV